MDLLDACTVHAGAERRLAGHRSVGRPGADDDDAADARRERAERRRAGDLVDLSLG
jgi:hypothetical protein